MIVSSQSWTPDAESTRLIDMFSRRTRGPQFPAELLDEARRNPGGYVYEIDPRFDVDGAIPAYAVRRGWEVSPDGQPTGKFTDNPNYGIRQPLADVQQLMADAAAQSSGDEIELLVRHELTHRANSVDFDVAIRAITDYLAGLGFAPSPTAAVSERPDGHRYVFIRQS